MNILFNLLIFLNKQFLSKNSRRKYKRDLSPPFVDDEPFGGEHAAHVFNTKRNFMRIHCGRCEVAIRFGVLYVKCQRCKGF
jgi:hypothetical protein